MILDQALIKWVKQVGRMRRKATMTVTAPLTEQVRCGHSREQRPPVGSAGSTFKDYPVSVHTKGHRQGSMLVFLTFLPLLEFFSRFFKKSTFDLLPSVFLGTRQETGDRLIPGGFGDL